MITVEVYLESDEYIRAAISNELDDVRTGTIEFGVSESDTPPATWSVGEWEAGGPIVAEIDGEWMDAYMARILSDDLGLETGTHYVFTRLLVGEQNIIKLAGRMKVKA